MKVFDLSEFAEGIVEVVLLRFFVESGDDDYPSLDR